MIKKILLLACALGIQVVFTASALAEVYKWKDSGGKIHFSDRNPNQSAEQVDLKPDISKEKREQAHAKMKTFVDKQQRKSAFQKEQADKAKKKDKEEVGDRAKKKNDCVKARKELRTLKMSLPVYRTDKAGKRSYLGDAQRKSEINEWSRNIRKYCE